VRGRLRVENRVPEDSARLDRRGTRGSFPNLTQEIRSERCNHCAVPPCVPPCPTGASHVESEDRPGASRSVHGARRASPAARTIRATCIRTATWTVHVLPARVRDGRDPACVSTCPTFAMSFGDLHDPDAGCLAPEVGPDGQDAPSGDGSGAERLLPALREGPPDGSELDIYGANPGISPHLHAWGWEIPCICSLAGWRPGSWCCRGSRSSCAAARNAVHGAARPLLVLPLLAVGMGALFLDLAYKLHVFRFTPPSGDSPMSWGS